MVRVAVWVSAIDMALAAFLPALYAQVGLYVKLIVAFAIIISRLEPMPRLGAKARGRSRSCCRSGSLRKLATLRRGRRTTGASVPTDGASLPIFSRSLTSWTIYWCLTTAVVKGNHTLPCSAGFPFHDLASKRRVPN